MFLDIETLPAESDKKDILLELYQRKVDKNRNGITQTFEEYLESTGLDGSFGRICCISYAIDAGPVTSLSGDEHQVLVDFWSAAKDIDLFVGFNILDFDLKFIYQRSIILNVRPTQQLSFVRYKSSPIYDVMHEWTKWSNLGKVGLHALAKALGLPSSKEGDIEGKDVAKAYAAGRIKDICDYCQRDVEVTRSIYQRLTFT